LRQPLLLIYFFDSAKAQVASPVVSLTCTFCTSIRSRLSTVYIYKESQRRALLFILSVIYGAASIK